MTSAVYVMRAAAALVLCSNRGRGVACKVRGAVFQSPDPGCEFRTAGVTLRGAAQTTHAAGCVGPGCMFHVGALVSSG